MSERPKSDSPTVEVGTLAKLFNLTAVRVQQLATDGIVIKHARGRYDLWTSIRNYIKYLQERKVNQWSGSGEGAGDYEGHRARLTKAKADIAELDAELKKGTAHDAEAVAAVWADMIGNARAKLLSLPTTLASQLEGMSIQERKDTIQNGVNEALRELADYSPEIVTNQYVAAHSEEPQELEAEDEDEPDE
jgi:phage terminase Nu1 subunit (DNA packaging protein)